MNSISFITAYIAGLTAFFSPCLLPLLPSYFSILTGYTFKDLYGLNFDKIRVRVFLSSLCFVIGFAIIFSLIGLTSSLIGQILLTNLYGFIRLGGAVLILFGLIQIGVIKFESLQFDYAWNVQRRLAHLGYLTALITGMTFALIWIPCIGPILGSILIIASKQETAIYGANLLILFAAGLGTPFLLLGLFFPTVFSKMREQRHIFHALSRIAGVIMIIFGIVLLLNQYAVFLGIFSNLF